MPAPAPPATAPPPMVAAGDVCLPMCDAFSVIWHALTELRASPPASSPPPAPPAEREKGRAGGQAMRRGAPWPPLPLPTPPPPLQEAAEVKPACGAGMGAPAPAGGAPPAPVSDDPPPPPPAPAAAGAAGGGIEEAGATAPHADPVQCAQGPRVQVLPRAPGGIAALGTTRGTLSWCQWRVVCDSARSSGWEACACPAPH